VKPENTTDKTVAWKSADERIATVDSNGTVTAVAVGSVDVTASCGEVKAVCKVTVDDPDDITRYFDPEFAAELQRRGYIPDASRILKSQVRDITKLYLGYSGAYNDRGNLTSLAGIEFFESLQELSCFHQRLVSVDVSRNTKLTNLSFEGNRLTSVDISRNTELKDFSCYGNQLTSLDISKNTKLTRLFCSLNQLTTLDVTHNPELNHLQCFSNQLTALDVSRNTKLYELYCPQNQLKTLKLSPGIVNLICFSNRLTALDLSNNTRLAELRCSNNELKTLDVSQNTVLTILECAGNQLTALDLSNNKALIHLNCSTNQLTSLDVSKTALGNSTETRPLDCYMPTLQTLYLKTGWRIDYINHNRNADCIHPDTEIRYKD